MNEVRIGSTRINEATTTTGKKMLAAYREDGTRLLMDVMSSATADGQTGYVFDNKLIIAVHWENFSEEDKVQTAASEIRMRFCATENGFWSFVKFGSYEWGDIITLPGLISGFNTAGSPITDVIFYFIDSLTGKPIAMRTLPLSDKAGTLLSQRNAKAYSFFSRSGCKASSYSRVSALFDDWLYASAAVTRTMTSASPLAKPAFLTLTAAPDNTVREEFPAV